MSSTNDQCEGGHELTAKHILIECNFLKMIDQIREQDPRNTKMIY